MCAILHHIWFPVRLSGDMVPCQFLKGFIFSYVHVCSSVRMYARFVRRCLQTTEESIESPGAGVTVYESHLIMSAGSLTLVLWKTGSTLLLILPPVSSLR